MGSWLSSVQVKQLGGWPDGEPEMSQVQAQSHGRRGAARKDWRFCRSLDYGGQPCACVIEVGREGEGCACGGRIYMPVWLTQRSLTAGGARLLTAYR